jgi:hypothetical protein
MKKLEQVKKSARILFDASVYVMGPVKDIYAINSAIARKNFFTVSLGLWAKTKKPKKMLTITLSISMLEL